jgi:hypothetical protein
MRRFVLAAAVFVPLALAGALAPACGGDDAPTPTPTDAELYELLSELPSQAVLSLAFPAVPFQPVLSNEPPLTFFMPDHPGARQEVMGHLIGHLTQSDRPQLATFLHLREGNGDHELQPALGLEAGLYMVLVSLDRGQPALGGLTMLEASAQEFLEFAQAQEEGRLPFHNGVDNPTANGTIRPAVASDVDNDGLDELLLLDSGANQGVEAAVYLIFDWTGADLRWRRIGTEGDSASIPSKAVLDYLAAVEAAGGTAEAWDGTPRLLAWEWLSVRPPTPISPELLAELAPESGPDGEVTARRKLEATRSLLESAYGLLSADWQKRQPWTDFVYGFRNTTGVRIEQLLPPRQEKERMVVEVVITAASREGSVPVDRRFRVVYTVVEEASGWRLDSLDAREEALPQLP